MSVVELLLSLIWVARDFAIATSSDTGVKGKCRPWSAHSWQSPAGLGLGNTEDGMMQYDLGAELKLESMEILLHHLAMLGDQLCFQLRVSGEDADAYFGYFSRGALFTTCCRSCVRVRV